MKVEKNRCECDDHFCTARKSDKRPSMTLPCFTCHRWTCLSCMVEVEVRVTAGRTYGRQRVCHDCAATLGEDEIVRRHLRVLAGRDAEIPASWQGRPVTRREKSAARRKPGTKARSKVESSRRVPLAAPTDAPATAPARARPYPREFLEKLGYAR